jgi:D-3-phosphoglycerate dehydrogenase
MKPRVLIVEPDRYPERAKEILHKVADVRINDGPDLKETLGDTDAVVVRLKYLWNKQLLARAPQLKAIATATTGLDHIDLQLAESRGVTVLSLKGETEFLKTVTATAEHTWGLLLALIRHIPQAHRSVVNRSWERDRFFGTELQGRTLGIVGLGRIGQMVARYGLAFRMKVIAYDRSQKEWVQGVEKAKSLTEVLLKSNVLSIHVPLTKENEKLIGPGEFAALKPGAIVLNTSRGAVLDEDSLLAGLISGRLGGAALDVIQDEYKAKSELREQIINYAATHSNLLLTPHIGGATHDSLERVEVFMAEKLRRFLQTL